MISLKKPRSCKNCQFSEDNGCILRFPTERSVDFPYIPYPLTKCYKVTSYKDYCNVIKYIEVYEYLEVDDV